MKQPTWKIQVVGADPDYPTEQQARTSAQACEWAEARKRERAQLQKYEVFTRIPREKIPEAGKIVDTKWVYVIQRRPEGSIDQHKGRKVGRGFTQEQGINYVERYSQMR